MKIIQDLFLTEDGWVVLGVTLISVAVAWGIRAFIQKQVKALRNFKCFLIQVQCNAALRMTYSYWLGISFDRHSKVSG
jgi:hypothetical protein